jgi:5'-phosphate synthase pdxT subunit
MTTASRTGRPTRPTVGVFALQGDFAAHREALGRLGIDSVELRAADDLDGAAFDRLSGLVLPGGESTTMLHLLRITGLEPPLRRALASGRSAPGRRLPVLATCAGVILLARHVTKPDQPSFGVLDLAVERNGYGRQVHSGSADLDWDLEATARSVGFSQVEQDPTATHGVFIRAPRIVEHGSVVTVLARRGGDPVLVEQDEILGCGFHPELVPDHAVTRAFAERVHTAWIGTAIDLPMRASRSGVAARAAETLAEAEASVFDAAN